MEDQINHPTVLQKVAGQFRVSSIFSQDQGACKQSFYKPSVIHERRFQARSIANNLPMAKNSSPVFAQAPSEKGFAGFAVDFLMGGVSGAVSKTVTAPIERVKLLIQNQDEMIKSGRLSEPYKGIADCFSRTVRDEGIGSLWRGNVVNVIRYFPTQVRALIKFCHRVRRLHIA